MLIMVRDISVAHCQVFSVGNSNTVYNVNTNNLCTRAIERVAVVTK